MSRPIEFWTGLAGGGLHLERVSMRGIRHDNLLNDPYARVGAERVTRCDSEPNPYPQKLEEPKSGTAASPRNPGPSASRVRLSQNPYEAQRKHLGLPPSI